MKIIALECVVDLRSFDLECLHNRIISKSENDQLVSRLALLSHAVKFENSNLFTGRNIYDNNIEFGFPNKVLSSFNLQQCLHLRAI